MATRFAGEAKRNVVAIPASRLGESLWRSASSWIETTSSGDSAGPGDSRPPSALGGAFLALPLSAALRSRCAPAVPGANVAEATTSATARNRDARCGVRRCMAGGLRVEGCEPSSESRAGAMLCRSHSPANSRTLASVSTSEAGLSSRMRTMRGKRSA